jgi:hypothetical protein
MRRTPQRIASLTSKGAHVLELDHLPINKRVAPRRKLGSKEPLGGRYEVCVVLQQGLGLRTAGPRDWIERSEHLDPLRARLRSEEQMLAKFGFDPSRGIETYSPTEAKAIIASCHDPKSALRTLRRVIRLQETLYRRLIGPSPGGIDIDTDRPETTLERLKASILGNRASASSCSSRADRQTAIARALSAEGDPSDVARRVLGLARRLYKRDYDRTRVVEALLGQTTGAVRRFLERGLHGPDSSSR